ncbi:MAG: hypothetical protein ACK4UL_12895 [Novosphingobium meiothermophilum]|uniref:hypothetical protein n=1 Tax=Novosphingobium TaxID=165696 RepID=UPI001F20BB72|nr:MULTISPECIES: hypothetical protein [Novosphingobium]
MAMPLSAQGRMLPSRMTMMPDMTCTPEARRRILLPALCAGLVVAVSACGSGTEEKPGGVTRDEAAALDAAAEMLDERELPARPQPSDAAPPVPQPS